MPTVLTQEEFTQCFTDRITFFGLAPESPEPLAVELHYGEGEPVLKLSLADVYDRYTSSPDELESLLAPYIQDLKWTVQEPRYGAKAIYDQSFPILRNLVEDQPPQSEVENDPLCPKGPIVYQEVLRGPTEFIVAQFFLSQDSQMRPLRRGDVLPCSPDVTVIGKLAFTNLAVAVDEHGLTAQPLQFESLQVRAYLIELTNRYLPDHVTALSCVPQVMLSLEESLSANQGLLAIMPSVEQLIVSGDTSEQSLVELGVLAQQLKRHAAKPLSSYVWSFKQGSVDSVQMVELQEEASESAS